MIFPGSFDPFTLGHVDVARRAAAICDHLYVAVMTNCAKKTLFSSDERVEIAKRSLQNLPEIEVVFYTGLLVDFFRETGACAVVRGIRSESDFRNEAEMMAANRWLYPGFDAILLPCQSSHAYTSSSIVKEVASYGGDISGMIAPSALEIVRNRILKKRRDLAEDRTDG